MIEIKMMKYQFGRTSEEAVQAMLVERWQIQSDNIITEEGRTFYAVVWQRMTPESIVERTGGGHVLPELWDYDPEEPIVCVYCGVNPIGAQESACNDCYRLLSDNEIEEGMGLILANGEQVTVSGITMKDGEIHRVKVTKPHPDSDNDTNVTTTMKLETLIAKLPETHRWHDTPPTYDPPANG